MNKDLYELSYSLRKQLHRKIFNIVFAVITIFVVINLVLSFVIFPVRQMSVSMEPDLPSGASFFCSPLSKSYSRGDVVLLKPHESNSIKWYKKALDVVVSFFTGRQFSILHRGGNSFQARRVLAVPGDTIYMRDYVLYVRPKGDKFFLTEFELSKKSYNVNISAAPALWDMTVGVKGSFEQIELGRNQYFVLADVRSSSADSRLWGIVPESEILAKALICYFPFNRIKKY